MHDNKRRYPKSPSLFRRLLFGLCGGCLLLALSGCYGPSALERDYGKSWAYNQAVQVANPDAALAATPATGLSPQAASHVMSKYDKSFSGKAGGGGGGTTTNLSPVAPGGGDGGK
ncbi:MAG: hypothetical protein ACUVRZ_03385 [Desulfobacca sp.]|uniref:hypothetical protein n=1 Tax=Desulfobacca sp. TaxID=2067990 RepID=UPI00404ABA0A